MIAVGPLGSKGGVLDGEIANHHSDRSMSKAGGMDTVKEFDDFLRGGRTGDVEIASGTLHEPVTDKAAHDKAFIASLCQPLEQF